MAEFVADHAFEFPLVEQMDDGAVELHAVKNPPARQQFEPQRVGVHVLFPREIDAHALPGEAEPLLHAPGGGEQGVAGVRAEAGVGPHVFEAFAVGKKLRRHEVEHPENGEREEQRRLPVGQTVRLRCPPRQSAHDDGHFARDPEQRAHLVRPKTREQRRAGRRNETPRLREWAGRVRGVHRRQVTIWNRPRIIPTEGRARV